MSAFHHLAPAFAAAFGVWTVERLWYRKEPYRLYDVTGAALIGGLVVAITDWILP